MEAVGRRPRFEGAAAQNIGSLGADFLSDPQRLLFAFDGAGTGHDHDVLTADDYIADLNRRIVRLQFTSNKLVGLRTGQHSIAPPGDVATASGFKTTTLSNRP